MRAAIAGATIALAVIGCGLASDSGNTSPTILGVDCGSESDWGANQAGRDCLLMSFLAGETATFVSRMTTIEGDPVIRTYTVVGASDVRIAHDARADTFGSGTVELLRCTGLVPVAEWNALHALDGEMSAQLVFIEDGCETTSP